jgi:rhodanese-related sulfurtransferase
METSMTQVIDPTRAKAFFEQKVAFTTGPVELDQLLKNDPNHVTVIDVREAEDFAKGHIPGAINVPKADWDSATELSKDKANVVYCYSQVCHLGAKACVAFASGGFPVMELEGGFEGWKEHDMQIEHHTASRLNKVTARIVHH